MDCLRFDDDFPPYGIVRVSCCCLIILQSQGWKVESGNVTRGNGGSGANMSAHAIGQKVSEDRVKLTQIRTPLFFFRTTDFKVRGTF